MKSKRTVLLSILLCSILAVSNVFSAVSGSGKLDGKHRFLKQVIAMDGENRLAVTYQINWDDQWQNIERTVFSLDVDYTELVDLLEEIDEEIDFSDLTQNPGENLTFILEVINFGFPADLYFLTQQWENEQWVDVSRVTGTPTISDQLGTLLIEEKTDGVWSELMAFGFTYGIDGLLSQVNIIVFEIGTDPIAKVEIVYDTQNAPLYTFSAFVSAAWVDAERYLYDYNPDTPVENSPTFSQLPNTFTLENYPNPFNPATTIRFSLAIAGEVTLEVFDLTGRLVNGLITNKPYPAGVHSVLWTGADKSGRPAPSGIYLYRMQTSGNVITQPCILLK